MQEPHGFALIELLVANVIVAILVRLSAPSFVRMVHSNSMTSTVNSYLADLRFARSEAVRRGSTVIMCRSDTPEASTPSCATGTGAGWESGWIIFEDSDTSADYTTGEPLLRVQSKITVIDSIADSGNPTKFKFNPTGQLTVASTKITFGGTAMFDSASQRVVCVTLGGRGRIAGDGSATCP